MTESEFKGQREIFSALVHRCTLNTYLTANTQTFKLPKLQIIAVVNYVYARRSLEKSDDTGAFADA